MIIFYVIRISYSSSTIEFALLPASLFLIIANLCKSFYLSSMALIALLFRLVLSQIFAVLLFVFLPMWTQIIDYF